MTQKILKISFFTLANILIIFLIFLLLWKNDVFVLKGVRIYNNHFISTEEIFKNAKFNFSENIFKIDVDKIEQQLIALPMIESVKVTRFFPSILKVRIKEYDIIAGIAGSEIAAVTKEGHVISDYNPEAIYDLPVITGIHFRTDTAGVRVPQHPELLELSVRILHEMKKKDPILFDDVSEINFNENGGMSFILEAHNVFVLFGKEDYDRKLNYLTTIYANLAEKKILNKVLALDLRYEGQVVVKNKKI